MIQQASSNTIESISLSAFGMLPNLSEVKTFPSITTDVA